MLASSGDFTLFESDMVGRRVRVIGFGAGEERRESQSQDRRGVATGLGRGRGRAEAQGRGGEADGPAVLSSGQGEEPELGVT